MIFRRRQEPGAAPAAGEYPAEYPADYPAEYPATEPVAESAEPVAELARLREERTALIALCLYARDRVGSTAVADRIDARLAEIGVATVRPDGETFDPARHEASASLPTDDPALHNTVAETELPGYSDRGEAVRPPVVSVYQQQQQDRREPQ
jgi:hypothetical protein